MIVSAVIIVSERNASFIYLQLLTLIFISAPYVVEGGVDSGEEGGMDDDDGGGGADEVDTVNANDEEMGLDFDDALHDPDFPRLVLILLDGEVVHDVVVAYEDKVEVGTHSILGGVEEDKSDTARDDEDMAVYVGHGDEEGDGFRDEEGGEDRDD